jgi:hypothetical protein
MKGKLCILGFGPILMGLILSALIVSGCGATNMVTEDRPVRNFNRVSLTGAGRIIVTQGDEESLTVEAEDNIMPYIKTEVQDGTLILGFTDEAKHKEFRVTKPIKFYLSMKEVVGLDISGPGDIHVPSLHTNQLEIVVNMGGDVSVDSLTAEELVVRLTGRASVEVAGQVVEQNISLAGGSYRAAKLESQVGTVEVKNLGNASVWATETLDVQISGGGNVEYYGHPRITQKVTGRAKLNSLGEP